MHASTDLLRAEGRRNTWPLSMGKFPQGMVLRERAALLGNGEGSWAAP